MKAEKKFPLNLSQPAQRAFTSAGISSLQQCAGMGEAALAQLNGMGPNALSKIREAMKEKGLTFTQPK